MSEEQREELRIDTGITEAMPRGNRTPLRVRFWDPVVHNKSIGHENDSNAEAPEKELALFALRLAILEQLASGLGTLAFIWATVVLLGGFSTVLSKRDFWFVTIILVIEGARIYSRSGEIEWQHQSTWTFVGGARGGFRALRRTISGIFNHVRPMQADLAPEDMEQTPTEDQLDLEQPQTQEQLDLEQPQTQDQLNPEQPQTQDQLHPEQLLTQDQLNPEQPQTQDQLHPERLLTQDQLHPEHPQTNDQLHPEQPRTKVSQLSVLGHVFLLKNIGPVLIGLQLCFAIGSMTISLVQLISQNYGDPIKDKGATNRSTALNIFYSLAFSDDVLFLMEKLYWILKINICKLLERVSKNCGFGQTDSDTDLIKRFFYYVYSVCISDSLFDGLKKDLVSFGEKLLGSEEPDKHHMGAQIIRQFVNHHKFGSNTMRKVGSSVKTMERLVEMLSWKSQTDAEIRIMAAEIVSRLSEKTKGSIRIARIPGSVEAIASLLDAGNDENELEHYYSDLNIQGLQILWNLAREHENCEKIGNSPGVISKIIEFIADSPYLLLVEHPEGVDIGVKKALQVVLLLAITEGDTGNALRQQISKNIFIVGNIREILQHREKNTDLQKISIDILASLAMDAQATERISSTGGVIDLLVQIFLKPRPPEEPSVSDKAGDALSMLTLQSQTSCNMILQECNVLGKLVETLKDPFKCPYATRILRNTCAYATPPTPQSSRCLDVLIEAFPIVLERTMNEKGSLLDASIGLLVAICKLVKPTQFYKELVKANIEVTKFVKRLISIIKECKYPDIKVPRLRRFVIEHSNWMMEASHEHLQLFKNSDMEELLRSVANTTTEIENFHVFSGSIGLFQHTKTLATLVKEAFALLHQGASTSSN